MFNLFSETGTLPTVWKQAIVVPIFKKGKSSLVENYRPISLTCVACKIFETTLRMHMMEFFKENNVLSLAQHEFLEGHSTCTNLIESINDWTINISNGHYTRVAYIDFAKAFDTVCYAKLIYKLRMVGIEGSLLATIESFLSNRSQRVMINRVVSDSVTMTSGVPQGSVLGPLLFLVYINDLAKIFPENVTSKFFADDAKIYTEVCSGDDIDNLQFSLDEVSDWARKWQLSLSIKKCFTIDILQRRNADTFYNNTIDDEEIDSIAVVKDLGVNIDNMLKFHDHISHVVAEAKRRSFLIYRCFMVKNQKSLMLGYKSYILPILNYCTSVWSPSSIQDIERLESVQRSFTKKIPGLFDMPYAMRLKHLGLPSLELRRLRNDLVLCYKILHNLVIGPPANFGLVLSNRTSRGNSLKLVKQQARHASRKLFFSTRICNPWNALSNAIVTAPSVQSFKNDIKKVDLNKFLLRYDV